MSFFPDFSSAETWVSILALTALEVILGIDNVIFVSIVANQLPKKEQPRARNIGLSLALLLRILLLFAIGWVLSLQNPIFSIPFFKEEGIPIAISVKDMILLIGGLFLLYKSTEEVHQKLAGKDNHIKPKAKGGIWAISIEIMLVNIVFSFDSILTAIGMTSSVFIMMVAVIMAIIIMMLFTGAVSRFINAHPTMQMLALSFLILIGVMLIAEGFHQHVSKGYIYFAMAFSLLVELLNMRSRKSKVRSPKS